MEKIVGDWHTEVKMSVEEAKNVCNLGGGEKCCAFLACGTDGFECIRMSYPTNSSIFARLKDGTMNAKGEGGWPGCAWHGEITVSKSIDNSGREVTDLIGYDEENAV